MSYMAARRCGQSLCEPDRIGLWETVIRCIHQTSLSSHFLRVSCLYQVPVELQRSLESCVVMCLVVQRCTQGHPVHLWDACTGQIRATYRAYDAVDEVTPAISVTFSPDGASVWAGYNRTIHAWDVGRPGREYSTIVTHKKGQEGQPGMPELHGALQESWTIVQLACIIGVDWVHVLKCEMKYHKRRVLSSGWFPELSSW